MALERPQVPIPSHHRRPCTSNRTSAAQDHCSLYQEKKKEAAKDTEGSQDSSRKTIGAPSEPSKAREQVVKFLVSNMENQNTTWDHKDASKDREWYFI